MTSTPLPFRSVVESSTSSSIDDEEDFKDIYPDPATGESSTVFLLRHHFARAGYEIRNIEEPKTHPVLILHATRQNATAVSDYRLLRRRIQDVLCQVGFYLRRDELTVGQNGNRLLIAFQTGGPPADFEEILREPQ